MNSALMGNVTRHEVIFERGEGVRLYDNEGREYLDFMGGIAVSCLGHSHPALVEALREQSAKLLHVSNLFYNEPALRAADAIVSLLGEGTVYFCNSGTEANEAAIKLARKHAWRRGETERTDIVALEGSFHGRTLGALAATMQPAKHEGFGPMPEGFRNVAWNDSAALEQAVTARTAAVMVEPIQGEIGIREMSAEYAADAQRLCSERGALLVCDEIQTGVGRTGRWWGYEHLALRPDVVTLGKGVGGGFPVAATWAAAHVADALRPGDHGTTIGGGPLACAAVAAVLETVEKEGLVENAERVGAMLARAAAPLCAEVRGRGLLLALELGAPVASAAVKAALAKGLVVNDVTPSALRLAPPLVLTENEAAEGIRRLAAAIEAAR